MARLSNLFRREDGAEPRAPSPLQCRLAQRHEIDDSLRLLLGTSAGPARDEQVLDFLAYSMNRGVDVNAIWVAARDGQLDWSLLPVVSPGRTMLILSPTALPGHTPVDSVVALTTLVCRHHAAAGVQLAQLLLDPDEPAVRDCYIGAGFSPLAELVYLHRKLRSSNGDGIELPDGLELRSYSPQTDPLFSQAIIASYTGSLDCPALNGMRSTRDVIEGHKGTGEFNADLWQVLLHEGRPIAVLLLNRSLQSDVMELVYLGVAPIARGRAIGDLMMKLAVTLSARDGKSGLTLAVDSRNTPAMRLYFRHGMQRVGTRLAMIRDLRGMHAADPFVPRDNSSTQAPQVP